MNLIVGGSSGLGNSLANCFAEDGKGLSISMDIPINFKFLKIKFFFNELFKEFKVKINFSKDFICDKKFLEKNTEYIKFKKNLSLFNHKKKFNSLFSKRLNL